MYLLVALACALLAGLCLAPGLDGGFIFDDGVNIQQNAALHLDRLEGEGLLYAAYSFQPGNGSRALSMLTFALDYWRGGMDARVFKITNLVIHGLTVLALVAFLRRLTLCAKWSEKQAAVGGLVLALLWALHPLQVSSVLYVVQRMQTLCTLFMLLALWAYLSMRRAQIKGQRSRQYGALMGLFWVLGFASKEDAVLLPAYALVLELTVLQFSAASTGIATAWRRGYGVMAVLGAAVYALVVVPYFWHWDAYPGRDFSSYERLLTQARVLVMYLGQILLPLPGRLPFYYDDIVVSRGLLQPGSTLISLLLLAGLLTWAWRWRQCRPLFAAGVLLFFAGHFMTSNVLNLELAFEHRNQFPMIGIVLAVADLCRMAWGRRAWRPQWGWSGVGVLLLALGTGTVMRAYMWGESMRFAVHTLRLAPTSERAWLSLGAAEVDRSGFEAGNPWLDLAINTNRQGATITGSAVMLSNIVIYRTIRGDVTEADWEALLARLPQVPTSAQNKAIAFAHLHNAERGMALDEANVVKLLEITIDRMPLLSSEYLRMAAYIHNQTRVPEKSLPFLKLAVAAAPPGDPDIAKMLGELDEMGNTEWVEQLEEVQRQSHPGWKP
ncbi:MAG: hypothetical protein WA956_10400 [Stenotrophomonas sp.]